MKKSLFIFLASFLCVAFIQNNISFSSANSLKSPQEITTFKKLSAPGCSPDLASINFDDSSNQIPLLGGWGKYRMPVTANNDSANIYFQQGINMYYGFHIIEALASFEKSIKFDEKFAMGYWGKALAYGPNINDIGYSASPDAIAAVQKAKSLYGSVSPVERALIDAIEVRYSTDTTQTREQLNQLYADAMKKVNKDFPNSGDAAALYADALMVQHPWDLYDRYYNPKPWTPAIVAVLERLIKQFPENPGASHYYIHAIEGSKNPEKGLEIADRLGMLMPQVSHLVHMPSHIYIRSGQYEKGALVNTSAIKGYHDYLAKFPLVANNPFLYLVHNQHMQAACAAMDAQYKTALDFSLQAQKSVDSTWLDGGGYFGMYAQYIYMTPYFTWVRFGKWDDILNTAPVADSRAYAKIMWHYARGIAYARKHQFDESNQELQAIVAKKIEPILKESPAAFNPGIAAVEVSEKILQGVIAEEKNQLPLSITLLQEAVDKEDGMLYNEPKDWLLPARHYLGRVLLKSKKYAEAEKVYRQDLMVNPNNSWALTGLQTSLVKQNKTREAATVEQQSKKALARTDSQIRGSAF